MFWGILHFSWRDPYETSPCTGPKVCQKTSPWSSKVSNVTPCPNMPKEWGSRNGELHLMWTSVRITRIDKFRQNNWRTIPFDRWQKNGRSWDVMRISIMTISPGFFHGAGHGAFPKFSTHTWADRCFWRRFRRHLRRALQRLVISIHLALLKLVHDVWTHISQPEWLKPFGFRKNTYRTFFIMCLST